MKLDTLHDLFIQELQDLYDGEQQIIQALPQMLPAINSPELREAFETHLEETKRQVEKLEQVCADLGIDPTGKTCLGMEGILEEGIQLLQDEITPSPTLDAALIAIAQKIEHYEIAGYGTAAAYAKQMEHDRALEILYNILQEEKKSDEELSRLAEGVINKQADQQEFPRYPVE